MEKTGRRCRTISDYRYHIAFVDVERLRVMRHAVRPVDEGDNVIAQLRTSFSNGEYGSNGRLISVEMVECGTWETVKDMMMADSDSQNPKYVVNNVFKSGEVVIIDGQHRHSLWNELNVGPRIEALLYTRCDGKPATDIGFLFIGAHLKSSAGRCEEDEAYFVSVQHSLRSEHCSSEVRRRCVLVETGG